MAHEDPNCPRCTGPVREDWDWCQNCGYDPEGLKPMGWIPAPPPAAEPVSRRRSRRARNAEHAGQSSGFAAPAALLTLPPDIVDLTRIDRRVEARVEPPVTRPQPTVAPAAPVDRPLDRLNPPRTEAAPSRPRPAAPLLPPIPGVSPVAPSPGRETVYTQPSSQLELGLAVALTAVAALMAFVGLSSVRSILGGSILNMVATFVFILICLALAGGLAFQAYALVKVKVVISQTELVANNRIGRPRRVALTDIFSVKLATRHYEIGFGRTHTAEVPYVQVSDGAGFWIDALSGRGGEMPTRDQMAILEALEMIVATHRPVPPPIDLP